MGELKMSGTYCSFCSSFTHLDHNHLCIQCAAMRYEEGNSIFLRPSIVLGKIGGSFHLNIDEKRITEICYPIFLKLRELETMSAIKSLKAELVINKSVIQITNYEVDISKYLIKGRNDICVNPINDSKAYILYAIHPKKKTINLQKISLENSINLIKNVLTALKIDSALFTLVSDRTNMHFVAPCRGNNCDHINVFEYSPYLDECPICSKKIDNGFLDEAFYKIIEYIRATPKYHDADEVGFLKDGSFILKTTQHMFINTQIQEVGGKIKLNLQNSQIVENTIKSYPNVYY